MKRLREIALWAFAAVLGVALYVEHTEATAMEIAIRDAATSHSNAREAMFRDHAGRIGTRLDQLEADLRQCLKLRSERR